MLLRTAPARGGVAPETASALAAPPPVRVRTGHPLTHGTGEELERGAIHSREPEHGDVVAQTLDVRPRRLL